MVQDNKFQQEVTALAKPVCAENSGSAIMVMKAAEDRT